MRIFTGLIAALLVSSAAWAPPPPPPPPFDGPAEIDGYDVGQLWVAHVDFVRAEIARQRVAAFEALEAEMARPAEGRPVAGPTILLELITEDPSSGYVAGYTSVCPVRPSRDADVEPCLWRVRFVSSGDAYRQSADIGRASFDPEAAAAWLRNAGHEPSRENWQQAPFGAEARVRPLAAAANTTWQGDSDICPSLADAVSQLESRLSGGQEIWLDGTPPPPPPHAALMVVEIERAFSGDALSNIGLTGYHPSIASDIHALLIGAIETCEPGALR